MRTLRTWLPAATCWALLAACGGREGPNDQQAQMYMAGLGGRGVMLRAGIDPNAVYGEAITLKAKGDCPGAVIKLRQVAPLGPGYENAQTALGDCLLQGAGGADLSADYLDGLTWLRRAGDAGWPEAQARLAAAHGLGPTAIRNSEESAYWLALYRANTGKSRVGFVALSAEQMAAIETAIPAAAKAAGEKRAESWTRKVWIPPPQLQGQAPGGMRARGMEQDRGGSQNGRGP